MSESRLMNDSPTISVSFNADEIDILLRWYWLVDGESLAGFEDTALKLKLDERLEDLRRGIR